MSLITVNGNTLNLSTSPFLSLPTAEHSNFILVQGYDAFTPDQKFALAGLGVEVMEYVSENTYLCRYTPSDLDVLRRVQGVRRAWLSLKQTISLSEMVDSQSEQTEYEVDLILHDIPNVSSQALAPFIVTAARIPITELEVVPGKVRLTVHQDRLVDLAALDSVNRIEEVQPKTWYNDRARAVLFGEEEISVSTKYQGTGQIVCVADTGIDQGFATGAEEGALHPAFKGRIEQVSDLWDEDRGRDHIGHGTHVCGSIVGSGMCIDPESGQEVAIRGTAPGARLIVQSMLDWNTNLKEYILKQPLDLKKLWSAPYDLGARIHSNSWGDKWKQTQLGYESDATTIDSFVHENPDFVILIAAGNDANKGKVPLAQIGDNSAAKNCITVGATGSTRANDGQRFFRGKLGTTIAQTAAFSSRGPTLSNKNAQGQDILGRIKPDVVAPGVAVLSPAARGLDLFSRLNIEKKCGKSGDPNWLFMSGTSMATPLVAGCVALLREASGIRGKMHPSAALIKALLINGAVNHSAPAGQVFDYAQGFGRVDVERSIEMIEGKNPLCGFVDGGSPFEATGFDVPALHKEVGNSWESVDISIPKGQNKVVVTLAYSDAPGTLLQNDINLIVQAGGQERHGNVGDSPGFDSTNNVEKVIWENVQSATMRIVVRCNGFTKDLTSGFAVAWRVEV
ncbi:kp-43 peptidase/serine peptidase like protein [Zymoseptoria brevis]|uniref:Kp-43 peptidase/serine peptidase like protein n=1 Tax=Zymoseptoria brevis TaxID=1047168 RepID=A0A0F4G4H3_9PEZI|nr:kp-43 peptidase/serine peptidase like protein [Zymoseptoria brevis]